MNKTLESNFRWCVTWSTVNRQMMNEKDSKGLQKSWRKLIARKKIGNLSLFNFIAVRMKFSAHKLKSGFSSKFWSQTQLLRWLFWSVLGLGPKLGLRLARILDCSIRFIVCEAANNFEVHELWNLSTAELEKQSAVLPAVSRASQAD